MKSNKGNFGLWLMYILILGESCSAMIRTYGDSCGHNEPCLGTSVTCLASGVCGCTDDQIYNQTIEACLIKLGKNCETDIQCIEGARCNSGICKCDAGLYGSSNGKICMQKKTYKESCSNDIECGMNRNRFGKVQQRSLKCVDGNCLCDKKYDVFDSGQEICVGLVDSECPVESKNDDCIINSECRNNAKNGKKSCQCKTGYTTTSQRKCGKAYGHLCGKTEECADFICIEGKCTCKYPLHQLYDQKSSKCLSLVSGPCTFPKSSQTQTGFRYFQKCIKNAHCVDTEFYSECECTSGFTVTISGTCTPGFGQSCEPGDCDPDNISGLFCRNGVCDCLDFLQIYDDSMKMCRGLVGSRCSEKSPDCVEYASCVVPESQLPGKCLCDKYSQETINRTCDYHVG